MVKNSKDRAEERAALLRQGAGNYVSLCGVLAGFVAVIIVLVLTPGFFPKTSTNLLEFTVILLSISSFGYVITALSFVNISSTPLWHYKSLQDMLKDYAFSQYWWVLCTAMFLGGIAVLTFSVGSIYMAIVSVVGLMVMVYNLIVDWRALAKRAPPKRQE
jgi:hypothetical protein